MPILVHLITADFPLYYFSEVAKKAIFEVN